MANFKLWQQKFQQILHVYFSNIFEIYSRDWIERHPDSGIVELIGDDTEDSNYEVLLFYENDIVRTTTKLGEQLNALGWVGIVEEAFTSTIYKEVMTFKPTGLQYCYLFNRLIAKSTGSAKGDLQKLYCH